MDKKSPPSTTVNYNQVSISKLGLPSRVEHCLRRSNIRTIAELNHAFDDKTIYRIRNVGNKSIQTINNALATIPSDKTASQEENNQILLGVNETFAINNHSEIYRLGLPNRVENCLLRAGIRSVGELVQAMTDESIYDIRNLGKMGIQVIKDMFLNIPNTQTNYSNLLLAKRVIYYEWASAFEAFYFEQDIRYVHILLSRFGINQKTLQQLASELNVTRERIRQIQTKVGIKYYKHIINNCGIGFTNKFDSILIDLGDKISIKSLEKALENNDLLGNFDLDIRDFHNNPIDIDQTFTCFLDIVSSIKSINNPLRISINMQSLRQAQIHSIGDIEAVNAISATTRRKVIRKILFTGGIKFPEIVKILKTGPEVALIELQRLDIVNIAENWYSFDSLNDQMRTSPLQYAGQKMLLACENICLDSFCDGLLRYVSRRYSSLAQREVLVHFLKILGFEIQGDRVISKLPYKNALSQSEQCFIELVKNINNIISFPDIAEGFYKKGFSLPAATRILRLSPIVEKVETGLYKIRGSKTTWGDLNNAQQRHHSVQADAEISYGLDGIIRYKVTVNSWAFYSGVVNSYQLDHLAGKWDIFVLGKEEGTTKMDENFVWGLSTTFKILNLCIGDRVELAFNTWTRTLTVSRINEGENGNS